MIILQQLLAGSLPAAPALCSLPYYPPSRTMKHAANRSLSARPSLIAVVESGNASSRLCPLCRHSQYHRRLSCRLSRWLVPPPREQACARSTRRAFRQKEPGQDRTIMRARLHTLGLLDPPRSPPAIWDSLFLGRDLRGRACAYLASSWHVSLPV